MELIDREAAGFEGKRLISPLSALAEPRKRVRWL